MYMIFLPHRKHIWTSTACYEDSFTVLCVDDDGTSQETHLRASTASYGYSLICYHFADVYVYSTCRREQALMCPARGVQHLTTCCSLPPTYCCLHATAQFILSLFTSFYTRSRGNDIRDAFNCVLNDESAFVFVSMSCLLALIGAKLPATPPHPPFSSFHFRF
jgi:hypothetical protein